MSDLINCVTYGPGGTSDGQQVFLLQNIDWQVQLPRHEAEALMVCISMWLKATEEKRDAA